MTQPTRLLFALTLALTACSSERWQEWADQADDSTEAALHEGSFYVAATDGAEGMTTPEAQATAAAGSAGTFFSPSGCVTATAAGPVVTYVLDHCVGPFGYVTFTGTVVVAYEPAGAGSVAFTATSTGLQANAATISFTNDGTASRSGTTRTLVVTASSNGAGRRGTSFTRTGSYTLTWDDATECLGLDGDWQTTVAGIAWTTSVEGYDRCVGACPASGGSITWSSSSGTLSITYGGGATATWEVEARRDRTGTVALLCGGV